VGINGGKRVDAGSGSGMRNSWGQGGDQRARILRVVWCATIIALCECAARVRVTLSTPALFLLWFRIGRFCTTGR